MCAAFIIFSFAVILRPAHIPAQNSAQNDNLTENRVWLGVEEHSRAQLLIEAIATVEDSVFKVPAIRQKICLLFGGASVGEGQVNEQNRSAATASLTYAGSLKIRGQVRALATNADPGDFRVASREPATAEQRGAAVALAREIFSQHGNSRSSSAQRSRRIRHSHVSRALSRAKPNWIFLSRRWRQ
jgi:hypothetical protein